MKRAKSIREKLARKVFKKDFPDLTQSERKEIKNVFNKKRKKNALFKNRKKSSGSRKEKS